MPRSPFYPRTAELLDGPPSHVRSLLATYYTVQSNHHEQAIRCRLRPEGHRYLDMTLEIREHGDDEATVADEKEPAAPATKTKTFKVGARRCGDCGSLDPVSILKAAQADDTKTADDRGLLMEIERLAKGG